MPPAQRQTKLASGVCQAVGPEHRDAEDRRDLFGRLDLADLEVAVPQQIPEVQRVDELKPDGVEIGVSGELLEDPALDIAVPLIDHREGGLVSAHRQAVDVAVVVAGVAHLAAGSGYRRCALGPLLTGRYARSRALTSLGTSGWRTDCQPRLHLAPERPRDLSGGSLVETRTSAPAVTNR